MSTSQHSDSIIEPAPVRSRLWIVLKWIGILLGCAFLGVTVFAAITIMRIQRVMDATSAWTIQEGGLRLDYCPGKQHCLLTVDDAYRTGSTRTWVLLAGAPRDIDPPPEALFRQAWIDLDSTELGLCNIYPDLRPRQRRNASGIASVLPREKRPDAAQGTSVRQSQATALPCDKLTEWTTWRSDGDGLELAHQAVTGDAVLSVRADYSGRVPESWHYLLGPRPDAPPDFEPLLRKADIGHSDPMGLVQLYSEVTNEQKALIIEDLTYQCAIWPPTREQLKKLCRQGEASWLKKVLGD